MKLNESGLDRIIRGTFGLTLIILYSTGIATGVLGNVCFVLGGFLLITATVGFCPFYALIKFQTKKKLQD